MRRRLRDPSPGVFAVTMATGIVATDAYLWHWRSVARILVAISLGVYAASLVAVGVKLVRTFWDARRRGETRTRAVVQLLAARNALFASLTFVAGTDVLASEYVTSEVPNARFVLGVIALVAWVLLLPAALRAAHGLRARGEENAARGTWLLAVVATESLAIVAAEYSLEQHVGWLADVGLVAWVLGLLLYAVLIVFVIEQIVRSIGHAHRFEPDSWIAMGALAIAALASAHLGDSVAQTHPGAAIAGVVRWAGFAIWLVGAGLVLPIVALDVRKLLLRSRMHWTMHDPRRWTTVFPIGMFAAASTEVGAGVHLHPLQTVGHAVSFIALSLWIVTAARATANVFTRD